MAGLTISTFIYKFIIYNLVEHLNHESWSLVDICDSFLMKIISIIWMNNVGTEDALKIATSNLQVINSEIWVFNS